MSEPRAIRLVPPRPNLGPDPWPEPDTTPIGWIVALAGLCLVPAILWAIARVRRGRRPARKPLPGPGANEPRTPRESVIARAERARAVLVARGGEPWAAYTTDELATHPDLPAIYGEDGADRLVAFFRLADRAKFDRIDEAEPVFLTFPEDEIRAILQRGVPASLSRRGFRARSAS